MKEKYDMEFVTCRNFPEYMINIKGVVKKKSNNYIVKPILMKNGYYCVSLGTKKEYLHRLLAIEFIENPYNKKEIDHIDGNPQNNDINNLRWATHEENMNNKVTRSKMTKTHTGMIGSRCHNSKVVFQYDLNKNFIRKWDSIASIHRETGFSSGCISKCCRGLQKSFKGFIWLYKDDS